MLTDVTMVLNLTFLGTVGIAVIMFAVTGFFTMIALSLVGLASVLAHGVRRLFGPSAEKSEQYLMDFHAAEQHRHEHVVDAQVLRAALEGIAAQAPQQRRGIKAAASKVVAPVRSARASAPTAPALPEKLSAAVVRESAKTAA